MVLQETSRRVLSYLFDFINSTLAQLAIDKTYTIDAVHCACGGSVAVEILLDVDKEITEQVLARSKPKNEATISKGKHPKRSKKAAAEDEKAEQKAEDKTDVEEVKSKVKVEEPGKDAKESLCASCGKPSLEGVEKSFLLCSCNLCGSCIKK